MFPISLYFFFFFFNDTATTEIYTLSLHDALPISNHHSGSPPGGVESRSAATYRENAAPPSSTIAPIAMLGRFSRDRKSTRLNSSHLVISYAVFCLKKKKQRRPCTNLVRMTYAIEE